MKTNTHKTVQRASAIFASVAIGFASIGAAADGNQKAKQEAHDPQAISHIVDRYEAVSEALVQDNLEAAKDSASTLADTAQRQDKPNIAQAADEVAGASSLEEARGSFKALSSEVIALAKENEEYTVMKCPMVENGRWLQSDEQVANPYMGQKMPGCGMPASKKGMMMDKKGMKGMKGMKEKNGMMMNGMSCCKNNEHCEKHSE